MDIATLVGKFTEAKTELKATLMAQMDVELKTIFTKHPKLESFSWRQYTPYFNDGDTCVFGVRNDELDIVFDGKSFWDWDARNTRADGARTPDLKAAWDDIRAVLDVVPEEFYADLYGDHVTVTVTADGATAEEYSHD